MGRRFWGEPGAVRKWAEGFGEMGHCAAAPRAWAAKDHAYGSVVRSTPIGIWQHGFQDDACLA